MESKQQVVICAGMHKKDQFPDNVVANCAGCGEQCVHRPHYDDDAIYICIDCGVAAVAAHGAMKPFLRLIAIWLGLMLFIWGFITGADWLVDQPWWDVWGKRLAFVGMTFVFSFLFWAIWENRNE